MALPLRTILSALAGEFARAAAAADVYRSHLRGIYAGSPLLDGAEPSRVRIREASVSIPLALDEIAAAKIEDKGLTIAQIQDLLPEALGRPARQKLAETLHADLDRDGRNRLLSGTLKDDLLKAFKKAQESGRFDGELDVGRLDRLRRDFAERTSEEAEARFVYKTSELQAIDLGRIIRLELTLDLD